MPEISVQLARALKRGDARFLLFYCDHPSGAVRYWTRTGNRMINGSLYTGIGVLGSVTGVKRSTNLSINEVQFELRGVPLKAAEMLSGLVRNREATITLGAMSKSGHVTVDDEPMVDALLDVQKLQVDPRAGTAVIRLMGQQGFYVLDRAQDLAWTDQQQRSEFPEDCGFALQHLWIDRDSNWRAA